MSYRQNLAKTSMLMLFLVSCKPAAYEVIMPVKGTNNAQVPPAADQIVNSPNGFTFGTTAVFHLGNAKFEASTCQTKLQALPLNGRIFNFRFEVLADNTTVNLSITDLCGIDFDSNEISLTGGNASLPRLQIPIGATISQLPSLVLNKGTYTLSISSGKNTTNPKFTIGDYDDFIVGHVQAQGSNIRGISFDATP